MPRSTKEKSTKRWHDERMRKGVRHMRHNAHEQLKQGTLQAGREDHHKSSTLHHMVSSRSNNEGTS